MESKFFISSHHGDLIFNYNGENFNWGYSNCDKFPVMWGLYFYQVKQKNLFQEFNAKSSGFLYDEDEKDLEKILKKTKKIFSLLPTSQEEFNNLLFVSTIPFFANGICSEDYQFKLEQDNSLGLHIRRRFDGKERALIFSEQEVKQLANSYWVFSQDSKKHFPNSSNLIEKTIFNLNEIFNKSKH